MPASKCGIGWTAVDGFDRCAILPQIGTRNNARRFERRLAVNTRDARMPRVPAYRE